MTKVPKHKMESEIAKMTYLSAQSLFEVGYFREAIQKYILYIEEITLTAFLYHIRDVNGISEAIKERDKIFNGKKYMTFGHIKDYYFQKLNDYLEPYLFPEIEEDGNGNYIPVPDMKVLFRNLNELRNNLSCHRYFFIQLDPTNKFKRVFTDINYAKKILRKYRLILRKCNVTIPESLNEFLQTKHLMLNTGELQTRFIEAENDCIKTVADYCKNACYKIRKEFNLFVR